MASFGELCPKGHNLWVSEIVRITHDKYIVLYNDVYIYIYTTYTHNYIYIYIYIITYINIYIHVCVSLYNISIHMISYDIKHTLYTYSCFLLSFLFKHPALQASNLAPKQQHSHVTSRSRRRRLLAAHLPSNPWH